MLSTELHRGVVGSVPLLTLQWHQQDPALQFDDKRALRRALDHYVQLGFCDRAQRVESQFPPRRVIEEFFGEVIALSLGDPLRRGCMIVNSALEVAPHDAEFRKVLAGVLGDMESFFLRCVEAGQQSGTINTAVSAGDFAKMLLGVLMGSRVLARSRPEPDLLKGVLRPVLALLDAGAQTRALAPRSGPASQRRSAS